MHSTVRQLLWLKASGASQHIDTFSNYELEDETKKFNYFHILKDLVPLNPNPSIDAIIRQANVISVDLERIENIPLIKEQKRLSANWNTQTKIQQSFKDILSSYCKRNSTFTYY